MKIKNNIKTYVTYFVACVLMVSCNIEEDNINRIPFVPGEVENPVTITQVIIKDPNLSILEGLMRRMEKAATTPAARVLSNLNLPGNTTLFAPTDDAFNAFLAANQISNINNLPIATITNLVANHLITGKFLSTDLSMGFVTTQATRGTGTSLLNLSMYINTADGVVLNGSSKVVTPNVELTNGVIHYVDAVINLPSVLDLVKLNPATSTLAQAVTHAAGELTTNATADAISNSAASVTLFAPNNTAFTNLLTELSITAPVATIQEVPAAQVARILSLHVVSTGTTTAPISSNFFVSRTSATLQTLLAGTAGRVNFNGTTRIIRDPRARNANIIPLIDIVGSNGVVHTLDNVLLPTTL